MDGKEALNFFMSWSRTTLGILGVWPNPDVKNERLTLFHFIVTVLFVFCTTILTQNIQLILNWGDLDVMSDILACAHLPIMVAMVKMIVLWCYKKKMKKLLLFIIEDWKNKTSKEYDIMIEYGQISKKISTISIGVALAANTSRLVQVSYLNMDVWGKTDLNATRTLYLNGYIPYDWNYSPIFEITYFIEYLGAFVANLAYCGTDSFFSQIGFHLTGQFRILHLNFLNIVTEMNNKNSSADFGKRLSHIIQKHEHINRCVGMMRNTFNFILFAQLLACSFLFCMQGYQLILYLTDENSRSVLFDTVFIVLFLAYMLGNFYLYCYVAETLELGSITIARAAFDCNWFYLPPQKIKNLLLIIQRGRKPVKITAGKIWVLNLQLFAQILKTSLGYLSVLLTIRNA